MTACAHTAFHMRTSMHARQTVFGTELLLSLPLFPIWPFLIATPILFIIGAALAVTAMASIWILCPRIAPLQPKA